jgi:PAS domain S-box-containing protein
VRQRESESLVHLGRWVWDVGTGAVQWSEELHRIHGLDPAGFAGTIDAHLEPVHSDDRERVRAAMTAAVTVPQPLEIGYRIVRPDGRVRHLHARAEVALAPSDSVVVAGLRGICQDVTERTWDSVKGELSGPISAIVGHGRRLEQSGLTNDQAKSVTEIVRAARRLLDIAGGEPGEGLPPGPEGGS